MQTGPGTSSMLGPGESPPLPANRTKAPSSTAKPPSVSCCSRSANAPMRPDLQSMKHTSCSLAWPISGRARRHTAAKRSVRTSASSCVQQSAQLLHSVNAALYATSATPASATWRRAHLKTEWNASLAASAPSVQPKPRTASSQQHCQRLQASCLARRLVRCKQSRMQRHAKQLTAKRSSAG